MKNKLKKVALALIFAIIILINQTPVKADVGSFESYDSGGSSWDSSSSWDSGSSWDSWDSSSSWDSSGSYSSGGGTTSIGTGWIIICIVIIVIYVISKSKGGSGPRGPLHNTRPHNYTPNIGPDLQREQQVEAKIKAIDPLFNKEEFIASSKNLFIKLQQAWTDRDWSTIRVFETNELFEQHKNQLQGYIDNNQINVMDRICVNYANLYDFRQEGDKDILTVRLNSRMADYIIDATTKQVLRGDKNTERVNTYILTFIRKKGLQTKEGTDKINTTNCPNCGAPTQITSSGKCEYCGSVVTTGEYSWVLSNLERERI